ncbi:MAG: hypothetical protein FWH01_03735 [Oscillospiraceae bacterium]|nr:hypothetical protein [Oscillospiraceae bacterium]
MEAVLITCIKKEFDRKLAEAFVREGYSVFAIGGQGIAGVTPLPDDLAQAAATVEKAAGKIDIYVELSDERSVDDTFNVRSGLDEGLIRSLYEKNVLRPLATLEAFINLLDAGAGKRLCFIASAHASINESRDVEGYGYALGKAAMSNFYQMISNKLTPSGYTYRVYDPMQGEISPEAAAEGAFIYFTRRRGTEGANPLRDDEARLVFRDAYAREHAW